MSKETTEPTDEELIRFAVDRPDLMRIRRALERIEEWAAMCRNEMQGRLEDEAHRKAFMVLGLIMGECDSVHPQPGWLDRAIKRTREIRK